MSLFNLTTHKKNMATSSSKASIAILAIAAFIIVTTEFLIVGLLPALARDLVLALARVLSVRLRNTTFRVRR